jgi:AraC family transcriptional regulator of adaptative response/methylated-DNA-[protein]-cysteine methyltransferase
MQRSVRHSEARPTAYAWGRCSLGSVLVVSSEVGACGIFLGDDVETVTAQARLQFPGARPETGPQLQRLLAQVEALVDAPSRDVDFPLDVGGTVFQRKVWQAIRKIPPGSTASYTEVAQSIDLPNSVRAVARACGANPLALVIPCHRVVRSNGDVAGYRWGVARKRALLQREAVR